MRITVTSTIAGSGFTTFAITEMANFCTAVDPFVSRVDQETNASVLIEWTACVVSSGVIGNRRAV